MCLFAWLATRPLLRSALCQATCLLLPSNVLQLGPVHLRSVRLKQLLRTGRLLVAGRMSVREAIQRRHIAEMLMLPSEDWNGEEWGSVMQEFDRLDYMQ
ncbi:hypothetical protein DPEC_G00278850 [Dallia pectoralis]|uniref:Uncharacterized protein n=1 Tax=Dallia pectoralis TaxID=75939 RepID=A0ACC2FM78_DALPE|nr:hypothetical protein DPEC_G00278850 [Dallia pectoralis]